MAKFNVAKSVEIKASADKVYSVVADYSHWHKWSPWLILEPEAKVNVKAGGKEFTWEGKRTGSGEMKVLSENPHQRINMQVTFLKPWKSTSSVWFELKPKGESTELTWYMEGSLPFFMFWMKKMMTAYIGMDYQRGLGMLKDYIETGEVPSKLEFKGISDFAGCTYVGIHTTCTMDTVGPKMAEDFNKMQSWVKENSQLLSGARFSIYHKWDMVKNVVDYTSAYPVKEIPATIPSGFVSGGIQPTKVNVVVHKGPYIHLGNAWSAQYNMHQSKVFKASKKIHPFETYVSMPGSVPDKELLTSISFPVA